eukprot:gene14511-20539_t
MPRRAIDALINQGGHEAKPAGELTDSDDTFGLDWAEVLKESLASGNMAVYASNIKMMQGYLDSKGGVRPIVCVAVRTQTRVDELRPVYKLKSSINVEKIPTSEDMACTPSVDEFWPAARSCMLCGGRPRLLLWQKAL